MDKAHSYIYIDNIPIIELIMNIKLTVIVIFQCINLIAVNNYGIPQRVNSCVWSVKCEPWDGSPGCHRYASINGVTAASRFFSRKLKHPVSMSTVLSIKKSYNEVAHNHSLWVCYTIDISNWRLTRLGDK